MLHAEGSYVLPTNVPANEFLNLEGQKSYPPLKTGPFGCMNFWRIFPESKMCYVMS